ncbi:MAG: universal stress protein [Pseudomonadota bacterium]
MYKSILVPVDLGHGDVGARIVEVARTLAGTGSTITLMTALEEVPGYIAQQLPAGTVEKTAADAREALLKLGRSFGIEAVADVRIGRPHSAILAEAEAIGADLIIIGSHRPGLSDYFLGSTAARVVRHATCAVLVDR